MYYSTYPLPFTILQFSIDLGSGHTPSVCGLYGMAGGGGCPACWASHDLSTNQSASNQARSPVKPTGRTGWWWIKPQLVQGETKPPCQKKTPKLLRNLSSMIKDFSWGQYFPSRHEQDYQVSKFHHDWSTIDWKFWHKRALNLEHWQNICLDDRFSSNAAVSLHSVDGANGSVQSRSLFLELLASASMTFRKLSTWSACQRVNRGHREN